MLSPHAPSLWFLRRIFFGVFLVAAAVSRGASGGFSATLSTEQKNATGLTTLTPAESDALDRLIAVDVAQARAENSVELEGTFVSRRTDLERRQAGLDRLTPAELTKLNGLVATAVAASPKPKERPRIKDGDVFSAPRKPEVHGEFSLTYGRTSGGGDFRAGSMYVDIFDPNSGLEIGFGFSRSSGKGLYGFYPGYPDYGYGYGYGAGLGWDNSPLGTFGRDDWDQGTGRIYGGSILNDWNNAAYYRGFRRP
ncbi:MAG TPA: hypothetical protein VGM64_01345 [Lacunisphaera sp.]|jgi:hypothetical protein